MSQHEEYTSPPGFRVSGGGGTKLAPVLIDPAAPASEGDVITRVGSGYAPQAPSGGGSGVLVTGPITVSSAELLDLHNTEKELVAPPEAGVLLFPVAVLVRYVPGTTPYTTSEETRLYWGWTGGSNQHSGVEITAGLDTPTVYGLPTDTGPSSSNTGLGGLTGQGLVLSLDAALAGGNGHCLVTVAYLALAA